MSLDISVPGGNPNKPGFSVQRSANGLSISAGALTSTNTTFGMMNDEGGLSVSAYPVSLVEWLVRACAYFAGDYESTLRGDVTVDVVDAGGIALRNIVTRRRKVWTFCPQGSPNTVFNNVSGSFPYTGPDNPGCGKLLAGRYRLSVYWWSYSVPPYAWSYNVIQEVPFTVAGPPTPSGYLFTVPSFTKRDNQVSAEW